MRKIGLLCLLFLTIMEVGADNHNLSIDDLGLAGMDPMNKSGRNTGTAKQEKAISNYLDNYVIQQQAQQEAINKEYQRLDGQTRSLQSSADYMRGEGAQQMVNQYNVYNVMRPLQGQAFSPYDQNAHLPQKPLNLSLKPVVIDPNRQYHLATWEPFSSDDFKDNSTTLLQQKMAKYQSRDIDDSNFTYYDTEYKEAEPMSWDWIKEHPFVTTIASFIAPFSKDDITTIAINMAHDGADAIIPEKYNYSRYREIFENIDQITATEGSIFNRVMERLRWASEHTDAPKRDIDEQHNRYVKENKEDINKMNSETIKRYLNYSPYETPQENMHTPVIEASSRGLEYIITNNISFR